MTTALLPVPAWSPCPQEGAGGKLQTGTNQGLERDVDSALQGARPSGDWSPSPRTPRTPCLRLRWQRETAAVELGLQGRPQRSAGRGQLDSGFPQLGCPVGPWAKRKAWLGVESGIPGWVGRDPGVAGTGPADGHTDLASLWAFRTRPPGSWVAPQSGGSLTAQGGAKAAGGRGSSVLRAECWLRVSSPTPAWPVHPHLSAFLPGGGLGAPRLPPHLCSADKPRGAVRRADAGWTESVIGLLGDGGSLIWSPQGE